MEKYPENDLSKNSPAQKGFRQGLLLVLARPSLLWKAVVSVMFVCISIGMLIKFGFKDRLLAAFSGVLFLYGVSRFLAFYNEYKREIDE